MKFGALPEHLLAVADLRLPPEPDANNKILSGERALQPKVYIGAAQWGHASWAGKVYPLKTPVARFRQLYPQHFNAVELNATHYTIYSPEIIQQWAAFATGRDFKFCPKFPQQISHHSSFQNTGPATNAFLHSIRAFNENLGPLFLQLSENYAPYAKEPLFQYLSTLPADLTFFLEVRHPEWFSNVKENETLFTLLQQTGIGAVITDAPGRRDVVHMRLTIAKIMIRFVCNGVHPTSFRRIDEWIHQLGSWIDRGMKEIYVFLHPGHEAAVPELATYWVEQLNKKCGLLLKPPLLVQPTLF